MTKFDNSCHVGMALCHVRLVITDWMLEGIKLRVRMREKNRDEK